MPISSHFEVNVVEENGLTRVELVGWLDSVTIGRLRSEMHRLTQHAPKDIVVDCARLDYIDSLSLGSMLYWREKLKESGRSISFTRCRGDVLNAFRLAGFFKLFKID
ncbi:MAG: STAS domain-containing protein [Rhodocyclaceae bacterium]|jgi:anti-anti-sigma factor|nr:STAS domain-containing protein [Rhodocyclaceae bacterium]